MARKTNKEEITGCILDQNLEDILGERFGRYSKYIIQDRALPDARDGLKPVQRRIIFAMDKEGNTYDHAYRKSAKTVGNVIGNYHPHGDTSVYDAMVRMSQSWKNNIPLVDMHGNNGSIDGDSPAAMRYTEARLANMSQYVTCDLPYDTVDMAPNFDDTEFEPTVLPSRLPMLLLNGSTGIAAGYATNIPPFNFNEIMEGIIYRLKTPKCSLDDMLNIVKGPDFPTGATIMGTDDMKNALATGKGKVVIRSKSVINKSKTKTEIVISEIPYEVVKQELVADIDAIRINKDIDTIADVRDESDKDGLRIVIEVKQGADANAVLSYLYKKTDLQINYNFNMVAIVDKAPKLVGLLDMIDAFIAFRKDVVLKRSKYILKKNEARIEILDGLIKATSIIDKVIKVIKASKDKKDVIKNLKEKFQFTEAQAEAIANMRLYRLSNTDITQLNKEKDELDKENEKLKKILTDKKELTNMLIKETREISKKYTVARRSMIVEKVEEADVDESKLVASEQVMLTVSKDGYIKRCSLRSFKSSDGETGTKDGDTIILNTEVNTLNDLIVIMDNGSFARIPVYKLADAKWKDVGSNLSLYIKNVSGKIILAFVDDPKTNDYVVTISKNSMIKKTATKSLVMPSRVNKMPVCMKLRTNDEIVAAMLATSKDEICIISEEGYVNRYSTKSVADSAINTMGLVSSTLGKNDHISNMYLITETTKSIIFDLHGKSIKCKVEDIKKTNRANKGQKI